MRALVAVSLALGIALGETSIANAESVMKQCGAQWQAAKAAGTTNGQTWPQFYGRPGAACAVPRPRQSRADHELFGFLTTEANSIVAPIHPKLAARAPTAGLAASYATCEGRKRLAARSGRPSGAAARQWRESTYSGRREHGLRRLGGERSFKAETIDGRTAQKSGRSAASACGESPIYISRVRGDLHDCHKGHHSARGSGVPDFRAPGASVGRRISIGLHHSFNRAVA